MSHTARFIYAKVKVSQYIASNIFYHAVKIARLWAMISGCFFEMYAHLEHLLFINYIPSIVGSLLNWTFLSELLLVKIFYFFDASLSLVFISWLKMLPYYYWLFFLLECIYLGCIPYCFLKSYFLFSEPDFQELQTYGVSLNRMRNYKRSKRGMVFHTIQEHFRAHLNDLHDEFARKKSRKPHIRVPFNQFSNLSMSSKSQSEKENDIITDFLGKDITWLVLNYLHIIVESIFIQPPGYSCPPRQILLQSVGKENFLIYLDKCDEITYDNGVLKRQKNKQCLFPVDVCFFNPGGVFFDKEWIWFCSEECCAHILVYLDKGLPSHVKSNCIMCLSLA